MGMRLNKGVGSVALPRLLPDRALGPALSRAGVIASVAYAKLAQNVPDHF